MPLSKIQSYLSSHEGWMQYPAQPDSQQFWVACTESWSTVKVCHGSKHLMSVSLYKETEYLNSFPNLSRAKLLPTNPYLCMDLHLRHWTV